MNIIQPQMLEQVTANLANFAYDPINWTYLHEAQALEVFLELLETHNQSLQLHGIAALCNICLDRTAEQFIIEPKHTSIIIDLFLRTEHLEIVLHSIALFLQILSSDVQETLKYKELLVTPALLKRIQHWRQEAKDKRVVNLCVVFLEQFGRRIQITEIDNVQSAPPVEPSSVQSSEAGSNN
ncbi:armadillo repeat-containing protein 7 isoform X1 [Scaptodrosophila lebanonensis]|uniref:Armadillo repeat-containing protein 7 isoform X1 n=1 Tax=Drosophila lebanonensis TaxID=7225 RepID=A0A6J2TJP3_DROLE|nr:armadillo repeat-containing protein 7 isoform X1 [Scaptodrosophila lebanonensis]